MDNVQFCESYIVVYSLLVKKWVQNVLLIITV
jgi:hypothetical protein